LAFDGALATVCLLAAAAKGHFDSIDMLFSLKCKSEDLFDRFTVERCCRYI
jgi:hypothetical protein